MKRVLQGFPTHFIKNEVLEYHFWKTYEKPVKLNETMD